MKIYSWNVLCFNKKLPEVCDFIKTLDFDVLCLQEVTDDLLKELQKMPFHLVYHVDVIRLFSKKRQEKNYVVILSRHEFQSHGTMQFAELPFPAHTRLFIAFMGLFEWSWVTERGAIYADVKIEHKKIRIFSIHLTLWGPGNRAKEFGLLTEYLPKGDSSVVCGDFNVIEYGPMKILNFLLGGSLKEGTPWYPERELFEDRFKKQGLHNPLLGKITHKFSRSQLDHVLVSDNLRVLNAWVVPDSHGSDHRPVGVEI